MDSHKPFSVFLNEGRTETKFTINASFELLASCHLELAISRGERLLEE